METLSDCISEIIGCEVPNFMGISWRSDLQRFLNAKGYFFARIDGTIEMHKSIRDPHVGPSIIYETLNGFFVEEPDVFHDGMNPAEVSEILSIATIVDKDQEYLYDQDDLILAVYMLARPAR